jgi:predicted DNA-binding transcriptional regulator AlpA
MPRGVIDPPLSVRPDIDEPTVSKKDICRRFSFTLFQLGRAVKCGNFPPPDVRLSARIWRWRPSTIENWIAQQGTSRKEARRGAPA